MRVTRSNQDEGSCMGRLVPCATPAARQKYPTYPRYLQARSTFTPAHPKCFNSLKGRDRMSSFATCDSATCSKAPFRLSAIVFYLMPSTVHPTAAPGKVEKGNQSPKRKSVERLKASRAIKIAQQHVHEAFPGKGLSVNKPSNAQQGR